MAERWIVNASPLIALGNLGCLDLLTRFGPTIVVPPAVLAEIALGPDPGIPDGIHVLSSVAPGPTVLMWGLGLGETEVLSAALSAPGSTVLVDDPAARRCAKAHGLSSRGPVGVLILAKRRGFIRTIRPLLDDLVRSGFHLSPQVVTAALGLAGE